MPRRGNINGAATCLQARTGSCQRSLRNVRSWLLTPTGSRWRSTQVFSPQATQFDESHRTSCRNHFRAACICLLSAAYHVAHQFRTISEPQNPSTLRPQTGTPESAQGHTGTLDRGSAGGDRGRVRAPARDGTHHGPWEADRHGVPRSRFGGFSSPRATSGRSSGGSAHNGKSCRYSDLTLAFTPGAN